MAWYKDVLDGTQLLSFASARLRVAGFPPLSFLIGASGWLLPLTRGTHGISSASATRPTFRMRAVHAKAYRCDSCLSMVLWFAHMRQGRRILTSIFLALCRFVFEAHDASARAGPSTDSFCLKGSPVGKFALQKEHRALTCGVAGHRRPKLKVSRAFAL